MFVGHYSVSFFAKSLEKSIPLWVLFAAVQLVDIFWAIFVLTGVEKLRIVPNFTRSNAIDLYFMPYTHSLIGALGWSVTAFFPYYLWRGKQSSRPIFAAVLVGAAVFSHWILDFIVHTPDLPLYAETNKVGLGLWNLPEVSLPLELLLLVAGFWQYQRQTSAKSSAGKYAAGVFVGFLILLQIYSFFGPAPESVSGFAVLALVFYLIFVALAFWLEKLRS